MSQELDQLLTETVQQPSQVVYNSWMTRLIRALSGIASGTVTSVQDAANGDITWANRTTTPTPTVNKDGSGGLVGLTLFKINFKNALNTFTSFLTNANTVARTYTFPDKDGTVAMLSDVAGGFNPVNVDAAANFAAGVLTLPAGTDAFNVIVLTTAAGGNITSIAGAIPSISTFQIKCAAGIVNTLETSLIAGVAPPAAGSIISNSGNFVLNGSHLDNVTLQLDSTMIVHVSDSINI